MFKQWAESRVRSQHTVQTCEAQSSSSHILVNAQKQTIEGLFGPTFNVSFCGAARETRGSIRHIHHSKIMKFASLLPCSLFLVCSAGRYELRSKRLLWVSWAAAAMQHTFVCITYICNQIVHHEFINCCNSPEFSQVLAVFQSAHLILIDLGALLNKHNMRTKSHECDSLQTTGSFQYTWNTCKKVVFFY